MEKLNEILETITGGIEEIRKAMVIYPSLTTEIKYLPIAVLSEHTVVAIIEVIRTEDDTSLFLYDIAITKETGEPLHIMTFGYDPCKPEDDSEPDFDETVEGNGTSEDENEDGDDEYCPDQSSVFNIEELSKELILSDYYNKMTYVTQYGRNYC